MNQRTTPDLPASAPTRPTPRLQIQRLNWAGVALHLGQVTLFLDAWTNKEIWRGNWTTEIKPIERRTPTAHAAITHLHGDHYDRALLQQLLSPDGVVFAFAADAPTVAGAGLAVRALSLFEPLIVPDWQRDEFTVVPVPAVDWSGIPQVSWVVGAGGHKIFHGGDTIWHGHWRRIGKIYGPFDTVFLPINGAEILVKYPATGIPATLTPEQAVAAAELLGAKRLVPIHYGFHVPGFYEESERVADRVAVEADRRGIEVEFATPGDTIPSTDA
jgi:L-ascorbate metabolism protein UlaG (beta-lactamase superfamily)